HIPRPFDHSLAQALPFGPVVFAILGAYRHLNHLNPGKGPAPLDRGGGTLAARAGATYHSKDKREVSVALFRRLHAAPRSQHPMDLPGIRGIDRLMRRKARAGRLRTSRLRHVYSDDAPDPPAGCASQPGANGGSQSKVEIALPGICRNG